MNSVINHGIIGYGRWGRYHAKVINTIDRVKIVAIADSNSRARSIARSEYPNAEIFSSGDILLSKSEINTISITTPDQTHARFSLKAIKKGMHVLCEKPLAMNIQDLRRIQTILKQKNIIFIVNHHNRFNPIFTRLYSELKPINKRQPIIAHFWFHHTPVEYLLENGRKYQPSPLWFLGPHLVDMAIWFFGNSLSVKYVKNLKKVPFVHLILSNKTVTIILDMSFMIPQGDLQQVKLGCEILMGDLTLRAESANIPAVVVSNRFNTRYKDFHVSYDCYDSLRGFSVDSIKYFFKFVRHKRCDLTKLQETFRGIEILTEALNYMQKKD